MPEVERCGRIRPSRFLVTFAFTRDRSSAAKSVVAARRKPLQPLRLGEEHSPQPALDLAFRNHLSQARMNSARRARRKSGWERSSKTRSETMRPRDDGGASTVEFAWGRVLFVENRFELGVLDRLRGDQRAPARRAAAALRRPFAALPCKWGRGQTSISNTSKGSRTDIATASVR